MAIPEKPSKRRDTWSETELRIWCVGGWRFQLKGGEVHRLDGPTAEEALARHLAVRHLLPSSADKLQQALSRKRGRPISKQSLHVATNKLRALIASAAGGGLEGKQLAKRLLPHASAITSDGSRTSTYGFDPNVWVDLIDAPNPFAFRPLAIDRDPMELRGGPRSQVFSGFEQVGLEAERRLEETRRLSGELPKHLEAFTPPIERLANLIPVALDRLGPGSMLVIQGKGESGRLHLTEAIELATLAWCGRGAEQIREQPETEPRPRSAPERASPGHLYILDRTRELMRTQEEKRLLAIHEHAERIGDHAQRPSLLVVTDGTPVLLEGPFACWKQTETISLPDPDPEDIEEAYLIATRGLGREPGERRDEFRTLATEYANERKSEIGLRAASSAASIAVDEARPRASELPPPDVEDLPLNELKGEERKLAQALAWFRSDPFTLEDARAATGRADLPRSEIFRIATKIPGGGTGTYEIHPRLLEAKPASKVPDRICKYLLEEGHEDAIERWPLRAMRVLDAKTVDIELRLRLAPKLVELSRDLGFAEDLQKRMQRLLERAEKPDVQAMMAVSIGRARLLTHLGRLEEAENVLKPITSPGGGRPSGSRAEAHLRLAIAASQRGNRKAANKQAKNAAQLSPDGLEERVERYHGWAALYSAHFEAALEEFQKALGREQRPEDRADATIGASLALLRLGRLKEAEGLLEPLDVTGLRSITRNRLIRAEATARFLRGDLRGGIEILDKALGRDETRASFQSADLLEARAYLHAKLGGDSLGDAERDLARSEKLLKTEDEWQKAVIYYLKALVAEVKMHASPYSLKELRAEARKSGAASVEAAKANPWLRARAHTLLARLEVDGDGDGERLARHLRAASEAHRELPSVCPDVLRETLELGAMTARAWGARDEPRQLEESAAELGPRDEPVEFESEAALALLGEIAHVVETRERTEIPDGDCHVRSLGTLGEALLHGAEEALARGMPLSLRLLHPRSTPVLPEGVFDLRLPTGTLTPTPGLPTNGTSMLKGRANRSFAEQRLGMVLLVSMQANVPGAADTVLLGQWLEIFRSAARKRGIATVGSIPIEPRALKALGLHEPARFTALGLAELPSLS